MEEHIPRRKASSASSASSGRTIKPSSRQGSATNGGFFARFRSSSQSRSENGEGDDGQALDRRDESEAGPSDYYRRSPSPQSPPPGWRTASSEVGDDDDMRMDGPRDEWNDRDVWADSEPDTPLENGDDEEMEGDASMSADAVEYQKRIRAVLKGSRSSRAEEGEEEGIGVEPISEKDGTDEVEIGMGEEEFGMQSPRSSAPSTPSKMPRQVSYIRT